MRQGFTLIELAIVLVIIGLIVGGVLVGKDMIEAARVQAQIKQIDKYNQAVNTFRLKYDYLPGDIPDPAASSFGFAARGPYAGEGDGNSVIEGIWGGPASNCGYGEGTGEIGLFWVDLSTARLIDERFNTATATATPDVTGDLSAYLPSARMGRGNYVYPWSGGWNTVAQSDAINYWGLSAGTHITTSGGFFSNAALTVREASKIDQKIDDGLPQSGTVLALYLNQGAIWSNDSVAQWGRAPATTAISGTSSTCYDNGNVAGVTQQYSIAQNGGAGVNCALSFRFQ